MKLTNEEREERKRKEREIERENEKREKNAKLETIRKEINFEDDLIYIIESFEETLESFDNKVLNKRFEKALQQNADETILNNNIIVNVEIADYQKRTLKIEFHEKFNTDKYFTKYSLKNDYTGKEMSTFRERLRHDLKDYYSIYIDDAFYLTETKKERLVSKNIKKALNSYIESLKKDIELLNNDIKNIDLIVNEAKEIEKEFNEVYKRNHDLQFSHDIDVLALFNSYYYMSKTVKYHY